MVKLERTELLKSLKGAQGEVGRGTFRAAGHNNNKHRQVRLPAYQTGNSFKVVLRSHPVNSPHPALYRYLPATAATTLCLINQCFITKGKIGTKPARIEPVRDTHKPRNKTKLRYPLKWAKSEAEQSEEGEREREINNACLAALTL